MRGDLPVEYSYNQAEFIAAMNRDVAGVINPEPAEDLNTTVNKTKEPTSESNTVLFPLEENSNGCKCGLQQVRLQRPAVYNGRIRQNLNGTGTGTRKNGSLYIMFNTSHCN